MRAILPLLIALLPACGAPSAIPRCDTGEYVEPGCAGDSDATPDFAAGCYERCDASRVGQACEGGGTCTEVVSNPCICGPKGDCCGACGQQDFVCL